MVTLKGLSEVADQYDGYVVDIWGVLHDGCAVFPGAIGCLQSMSVRGKSVVLLSNAPRRAGTIVAQLTALGISPGHYAAVLTSGDSARHVIKRRAGGGQGWRRCWFVGPPHNREILEGLDLPLAVVDGPPADFLLLTNLRDPGDTLESYGGVLKRARQLELPMLCANPDPVNLLGGRLIPGPGALARRYEELGGRVQYCGKPGAEFYQEAMAHFVGLRRSRILTIGDSLATDIRGARSAAIDSLLVLSGIHRSSFGPPLATSEDDAILQALCAGHSCQPTYVMNQLTW